MNPLGKTITFEMNHLKAEGKDETTIAQHIMQRLFDQAYEVISDGEAYKNQYRAQIGREDEINDPQQFRSLAYGKYEVTTVREPHWEGPELIFYAVLKEKQVPYKVTFFPEQNGRNEECSLELLARKG